MLGSIQRPSVNLQLARSSQPIAKAAIYTTISTVGDSQCLELVTHPQRSGQRTIERKVGTVRSRIHSLSIAFASTMYSRAMGALVMEGLGGANGGNVMRNGHRDGTGI